MSACVSRSDNEEIYILYFSQAVIGVGIEDEDRETTWMDDADSVSFLLIQLTTKLFILLLRMKGRLVELGSLLNTCRYKL